jgi:GH24 family phage-related lysozyme (muramidase)
MRKAAMTISPKLIQFLIAQEDGDQAYYDRTEEHFDWPEVASGPTVGVGYDLGYVTVSECTYDWAHILDAASISALVLGVGLTGEAAHRFCRANRDKVTITWAQALQEFTEREVPKWEDRTKQVLPNYDLLSPDCAGVLVSLSYNRGTSGYDSSLPRFREMVQIKHCMETKRFYGIPGLIRAMGRLWPNVPNLRRRRVLEAQLFAEGAPQCQTTIATES